MIDAQQIVFSEEVWIQADKEVDVKSDCTFAVQEFKQLLQKLDCYNCEELKHIACDCIKLKCCTKCCSTVSYNAGWKFKHRVQKMTKYNSNEDSDLKSSTQSKRHLNMLLSTWSNLYDWNIDSEAFTHITNCWDLFITISSYHKKFEAVNEETVTVTECEDVKIYTKIRNLLLQDVVFISECTSDLISLKQLQYNDVIYQDEDSEMMLTKDEHTIASAQCVRNLLILKYSEEKCHHDCTEYIRTIRSIQLSMCTHEETTTMTLSACIFKHYMNQMHQSDHHWTWFIVCN